MNVASLELSKKLYELSKWGDENDYQDEWYFKFGKHLGDEETWGFTRTKAMGEFPAYDSGYLLWKLPADIDMPSRAGDSSLDVIKSETRYYASYRVGSAQANYQGVADTPEDALCKLAIKLFEEGVL